MPIHSLAHRANEYGTGVATTLTSPIDRLFFQDGLTTTGLRGERESPERKSRPAQNPRIRRSPLSGISAYRQVKPTPMV